MSIGKKLFFGFATVLLLVAMLFLANMAMLGYEHHARAEADSALQAVSSIETVRIQMMQNRLSLRNYLLSGDNREVANLEAGQSAIEMAVRGAESLNAGPDVREALQQVIEGEREWYSNYAVPLIERRRQVDAGSLQFAELQIFYLQQRPLSWLKKSSEAVEEAEAAVRKNLEASRKSDVSAVTTTTWFSIVGLLIAVALGMRIAYLTAKSITEPLGQLMGVARAIGDDGSLDHHMTGLDRPDELGQLSRTFQNMVAYLKEMAGVSEAIAGGDLTVQVHPRSRQDMLARAFTSMVEGLRSLAGSVRDSATQVAGGANQVADASEGSARISAQALSAIDEVSTTMQEITINVQSVVRSTHLQGTSVSETSASIDQMVASIQRVANTATVLLDISNRSRDEVRSGLSAMEKTTDGLRRIHDAMQQAAGSISSLDSSAADIGRIVEVIDDLAEQTNLLALNATIEAARAGEHGLGFAVVADEVRKLAEKSAQSTREIAELIQSIQREARGAVDHMSKTTAIATQGLGLGNELNGALGKISTVVTEVNKFAQEIRDATNEQSRGSSQIAQATGRLNEITLEINSAIEEQATGAQAVVRAMQKMRDLMQQSASGSAELAASSEQMSTMARSLLHSMDRFVLEPAGLGQSVRTRASLSAKSQAVMSHA